MTPNYDHFGIGSRRQSSANLENPLRIGVALPVQSQGASQAGRGRKAVNSGLELHPAQILASEVGAAYRTCGLVIRHSQTLLCLGGHGAALEEQTALHLGLLEPRHGACRGTAHVSDDECVMACIGDASTSYHSKFVGRAEVDFHRKISISLSMSAHSRQRQSQ